MPENKTAPRREREAETKHAPGEANVKFTHPGSCLRWDDRPINAPRLAVAHIAELSASGISPAAALARGYRTMNPTPATRRVLSRQGFASYQIAPGLILPTFHPHGEPGPWMLKPDEPRRDRRRPDRILKYEHPTGHSVIVDSHPWNRDRIGDPGTRLWITEGVKKADSLVSRGEVALALSGVWNFKGRNAQGGSTVLADFDDVALNGREVFLTFDSDAWSKPQVYEALVRLRAVLRNRKADVRVVRLEDKAVSDAR